MPKNKMPGLPTPNDEKPSDESVETVESQKPSIIEPGKTSSEVSLPSTSKAGIEVVAERKGFYNQQRLENGDKFLIKNETKFGGWFKCVDPLIELRRKAYCERKKVKK